MKGKIFLTSLSVILASVFAPAAHAGWEYPGEYVGEGWYEDDGSRFTISIRGGVAYGTGSVENRLGVLSPIYVLVDEDGVDYCRDGICENALGYAELGNLPPANDFSEYAFAAGASVGWTVPYHPQWRLELGWDHVDKMEYNVSPLFEGTTEIVGTDITLYEQVGGTHSSVTSDIVSVMAFYDFYEGVYKPARTLIPYIGVGLGYAQSRTVLELIDPYGALALDADMRHFGELDSNYVMHFDRSETDQGNFAALGAFGFSYGLTDKMFLDLGARVTYIPQVKWKLESLDGNRHRDVFAVKNLFYGSVTVGLRFEF